MNASNACPQYLAYLPSSFRRGRRHLHQRPLLRRQRRHPDRADLRRDGRQPSPTSAWYDSAGNELTTDTTLCILASEAENGNEYLCRAVNEVDTVSAGVTLDIICELMTDFGAWSS